MLKSLIAERSFWKESGDRSRAAERGTLPSSNDRLSRKPAGLKYDCVCPAPPSRPWLEPLVTGLTPGTYVGRLPEKAWPPVCVRPIGLPDWTYAMPFSFQPPIARSAHLDTLPPNRCPLPKGSE